MLSRCFFDFSVGAGAFVIGLSQICSCFSYAVIAYEYNQQVLIRNKLIVVRGVLYMYQCRYYPLLYSELNMDTSNHNQFDTCIVMRVDFNHNMLNI